MAILGISFSHDGSVAVLDHSGKLVFAIGEERLNRIKAYIGFPFQGLAYIIENKIVKPEEITDVVIPLEQFSYKAKETIAFCLTENKTYYDLQNDPKPENFFIEDDAYLTISTDSELKNYIIEKITALLEQQGIHANITFIDHHLAHAACAYYSSGKNRALAITMDGEGDGKSASINICENGKIETISSTDIYNSAGYLYSAVTVKCGFKMSRHEGKITGLAAYGNYESTRECFEKHVTVEEGKLKFNNQRAYSLTNRILAKTLKWFGHDYKIGGREIIERCGKLSNEDLSAAVQHLLENKISEIASYWVDKTGICDIVVAGGVFANVKFNQRISEIPSVESLYVFPDMGDGGNAYGAAAYLYYQRYPFIPETACFSNVYFGPEFDNEYILAMLKKHEAEVEFRLSDSVAQETAKLVAENHIVGWFQGRMEYGPRALGNRSIIASPIDATINKWLNDRMRRTEFMPFAPSCLYEYAEELFDITKESFKFPANFMTITFDMKDKWAKKAPAVSHVDQTARPQLVTKEANPKYHALLTEYNILTGLPLVINTSFNIHEEPIVCKPEEGLYSLLHGVIDYFVCGDYICKLKKELH